MSKRRRSPSPTKETTDDSEHDFWISEKIEDRASVFQAFFSPNMPAKELQDLDQIKSASHRILAWRSPSSQKTLIANVRTLETGTDDDGERYGGRHVLKVLEEMRVEGALVVARWYGGVMLGPARFAHIENASRDAIRAWRQKEDSEGQKRRRIEDEDMEKAGLIVELADRDRNIVVLRGLLEEKTKQASSQNGEQKAPPKPVAREVDYSSMSLERLRQFDKARDSTVAFLLKKIDDVEKQNSSKAIATDAEPAQDGQLEGIMSGKEATGDTQGDPSPLRESQQLSPDDKNQSKVDQGNTKDSRHDSPPG